MNDSSECKGRGKSFRFRVDGERVVRNGMRPPATREANWRQDQKGLGLSSRIGQVMLLMLLTLFTILPFLTTLNYFTASEWLGLTDHYAVKHEDA